MSADATTPPPHRPDDQAADRPTAYRDPPPAHPEPESLMLLKRSLTILVTALTVLSLASVANADHAAVPFTTEPFPGSTAVHSGGDGAEWELIDTLFTGSPHTDLEFFTQDGRIYASVGTLGFSGTAGGQTIVALTDEAGEIAPSLVSQHPSASCASLATGITGLQHDIEATPKGEVLLNTDWGGQADTRDAQLLLDATDAPGRCHDNGEVGLPGAPRGGLEIIDVTDIENPVEIALTSHIGQAHTVNVDPRRPHIAYVVTSDSVGFDGETRANEDEANAAGAGQNLDGFELVDLSSCLDFPADATLEEKRGLDTDDAILDGEGCRPQVYRYRYPVPMPGHTDVDSIFACHELELYPDDRLACASGQFSGLFDVSGAFDDNGTPDDFTDDTISGDPLPCSLRASSSATSATAAPVLDCVTGVDGQDLSVPGWLGIGAPSVTGIEFLGAAFHQGRAGTTELPPFGSDQDIDFSHEAELTHSRNFLLASDERGGGVLPPDSSCSPPTNVPQTNGGLSAYAVDRLDGSTPPTPDGPDDEAFDPYARTPDGDKAIFRVTPRVPSAAFCTAHVFHQIPGQNRIFMGWYSQGTVVVDFIEHDDGTFEFQEAGFFIPENANTWVSEVFKYEENDDGTFTYYGATGDFVLGNVGRNAIDVYSVTLPAPPLPAGSGSPDPGAGDDDDDAAADADDDLAATGGGAAALALGAVALAAAMFARRRRA